MQIDPARAARTLQTIDKQVKDLAKDAKKSIDDQLLDSVDLSAGRPSTSFIELTGELGNQLQPLFDAINEASERQGSLKKLFGDPSETDEVRARAQELLDTYFSVEETGNRIFDFAFSFYSEGEDREAFARARQENIHEGFRKAEKILGGLADISLETRDYIDQRIEDFISAEGSSQSPVP